MSEDWTKTYSGDDPQRINKWLAQSGVCSRREAEDLIGRGMVSIDGERVEEPGRKIESGQTLTLSRAANARLDAKRTIMLNKPVGYVSGQPEAGQIPAIRLLTRNARIGPGSEVGKTDALPPIGRLDQDSRGLLILSDDGRVAKSVIGPDAGLEKEYIVKVHGEITRAKLDLLSFGMELDGRALKRAIVEPVAHQTLRFVLTEGRNRQIRRMCSEVRFWVADLFRIRVGNLELGDLPEGRWRELTGPEVTALTTSAKPRRPTLSVRR